MTADLLATADPEAAAFFADAREALTAQEPEAGETAGRALPEGWPVTPTHTGPTLTAAALHASRGHATRISFDRMNSRQAMWVGREFGSWSIQQGQVGGPASLLTSSYDWAETVRALNEYITPGRMFSGDNLTVDEWLPEYTLACRTHDTDCAEADGDHNFVRRRTLPLYPVGAHRPCGGGHHDGAYRYRFQVESRWRLRYGCRSHHEALLKQYLAEADGTVTVRHLDNHRSAPAIVGEVA